MTQMAQKETREIQVQISKRNRCIMVKTNFGNSIKKGFLKFSVKW
jgi:hypothetical protein